MPRHLENVACVGALHTVWACMLPGEFDTFGDMWWFPHAATIAFFFAFSGVRSGVCRWSGHLPWRNQFS